MKLILTHEVSNLGVPGDIVEVKDGYGRNFLLPRGFAILWSRGAAKQVESIKAARHARAHRPHTRAREERGAGAGAAQQAPRPVRWLLSCC